MFLPFLTDRTKSDILETEENQTAWRRGAVLTMKKGKSSVSTLRDVAKKADVSIATASRVLSNSDYPVSQTLRKRIIRVAEELNYTPNLLGKMLKNNAYHAVGVIVPTLQNPFFNQVILGVESAAREKNYEVVIYSSHRSAEQEHNNILNLLKNRVMALIIISIDEKGDALQRYIDCGGRVALLEADFQLEGAIIAQTDYLLAGRLAAQYLANQGHQKVALLTSPLTKSYRCQILDGVREAFRKSNINFSDSDVFVAHTESESDTGLYEFELGRQLVDTFLQNRKKHTAIIVINDITAFGVIQALAQRGLSVPDHISVISFDNITYAEMISPPLTTVELPSNSIGFAACEMLISPMVSNEGGSPDIRFSFPCRLKERQSVKKLN